MTFFFLRLISTFAGGKLENSKLFHKNLNTYLTFTGLFTLSENL